MCGIVGIYSLNKSKIPNLKSRIKKMIDMINYRGPDNKGFYFNENENFGMANNQLSIVSPRQKIKLPLSYDKKNHLSFNGEIYNYLNLRQKYKVPNKYFIHKTDTEILYYLLNQKHFDLSELNGMWSFAHYNSERHVLKIGRDILGERNLYYYVNKNELIFSSEIRPIFAANKLSFSVDNIGLQDMWKYYTCRDNLTIIKNCFKLTPGTYITFKNKDDSSISEKSIPILSLENNYDLLKGKTLKFAEKKFKELLYDELKLRLPNKVKSFSQLSGGIDSSFQNILLSKFKKLNTIYAVSSNINYLKKGGLSEIQLSKTVSKLIGSKHKIVNLRENFYKEALRSSENTIETLDPCILNFSVFSKILREEGCKVVLGSDGPDEFLCGYLRDINNYNFNRNNFLTLPYHKILKEKKHYEDIFIKLEKDTNFFSKPDERYSKILKYLDAGQFKALTYATKSLPEYINIRGDKGYMLNSIEIRQPYLSKKIVEFLCALPSKFRISKDKKYGKIFLRDQIRKKINKVANFGKTGFGQNLILDDDVYKKLEVNIKDTINDKKIFEKLNLKIKAKNMFLNTSNRSQQYMIFSLIRSLKNLGK